MSPEAAAERAGLPLGMLRAITRQMASAEHLDTVLQSIVTSLVDRTGATIARIFLCVRDSECDICRERVGARTRAADDEPALHLLASAGAWVGLDRPFHRVPLDSWLPSALIMRTRAPLLIEQAQRDERMTRDPAMAAALREYGLVGYAGYPLDFRGEMLGTIVTFSRRPIEREAFDLLSIFADQAAMAIKNAYLFRELRQYKDRLQIENAYLQDELRLDHAFDDIVGQSPALRAVLRRMRQVSSVDTTVLLTGETGTGKELVARAIHEGGPRKARPMIKVNCGAIPQGVVESELFGHEKGAFTGALQKRIGRFELADKGTLFMDEVGELPLDIQVKLLRVLQEQEFERVGSTRPIKVDVRLIAATNRDLAREVAEGRFRADLFYRLNVFPIRVPPLRERPEDIPSLAQHFLAHFQRKLAKPLRSVKPSSLEQLQRYSWPGNIRELQNVLERACVLARGPDVELVDALRPTPMPGAPAVAHAPIVTLAEHERRQIRRALAAVRGRVHGPRGAAALLGVNPSTLRSRMQKLGITKT